MSHEQKHPILQKLEEYLKNTPKEQLDEDWLDILKNSDMEAYYEKKYKDALERAKKLQETCDSQAVVGWCEYIFPEIREIEDERIKREILELVSIAGNGNQFEEIKDWLEKQGHMLDPDKVIEWLRQNNCTACWDDPNEAISQYIERFKKDFGL